MEFDMVEAPENKIQVEQKQQVKKSEEKSLEDRLNALQDP